MSWSVQGTGPPLPEPPPGKPDRGARTVVGVIAAVATVIVLVAGASVVASRGHGSRDAASSGASPVDDHPRCAAWVDLTELDCRELVNSHARSEMIGGGLDAVAPGLGLGPARALDLLLRSGQVVYARERPKGLWVAIHYDLGGMQLDPGSSPGFYAFAAFERLETGWQGLESFTARLPAPGRAPFAIRFSAINGRVGGDGSIVMPVAKAGWAAPRFTRVQTIEGTGRVLDTVRPRHGFFAVEEPRAGVVAFWHGDDLAFVYGSIPVEDMVEQGAPDVQHPAAAWTRRFRADADAFLRSGAEGIEDRLSGGSTAQVTRALERVLTPGGWRLLQRTEYRGSGGVLAAIFFVRSRTAHGALIFTYVKTTHEARIAAVSFAGAAEVASLLASAA